MKKIFLIVIAIFGATSVFAADYKPLTIGGTVTNIDEVQVQETEQVEKKTIHTLKKIKENIANANQQIGHWEGEKAKWIVVLDAIRLEAQKVRLAPVPVLETIKP